MNFGMSHTINGLSKWQNLAIVVYSNLLLLPTLYKVIKKQLVFSEDACLVLIGICMYIRMYICMYVCMMYVCAYTHTHTHTHAYIFTE